MKRMAFKTYGPASGEWNILENCIYIFTIQSIGSTVKILLSQLLNEKILRSMTPIQHDKIMASNWKTNQILPTASKITSIPETDSFMPVMQDQCLKMEYAANKNFPVAGDLHFRRVQ